MKLKIKRMPAVMTVLSALYFLYVLASKDTVLSADAVGGDPGGKLLPMTMAIFMFFGFLYITYRERPETHMESPEVKRLFFITLTLSVCYVLFIRQIGFVIISTILLYSLEYIYTTIDTERDNRRAILGGMASVVITVIAFLVMRIITRNLMHFGRMGVLPPIFASTTFEAFLSFLYVVIITFLIKATVCRKLEEWNMNHISNASIITISTVLFLYVVFKQFFNVNLAQGILNF